ncbi:MAG: hypothetical protein N2595_06205 [bacterium]|nr:hypothetical protein [bacterium]
MKPFAAILVTILLIVSNPTLVRAQNEGDDAAFALMPEYEFDTTGEAMRFGMQRGAANVLLGWLELPRNLSYEFTRRPLSAVLTGPLMGTTMTAMRTLFGVVDLLSVGYTGHYGYATAVPDYPWEDPWLSDKAELY